MSDVETTSQSEEKDDSTERPSTGSSSNINPKQKDKSKPAKKEQPKEKQQKIPKPNIIVDAIYTSFDFTVESSISGRELFDQVANLLELKEIWFFGLEYVDSKGTESWLKLKKRLFAQDIGKKRPIQLMFRPKFYPEDVEKELIDPVSQRLFYEHIKTLILSSELYCPVETVILLASYNLQEKYGNYNTLLQPKGFLTEHRVIPEKLADQYKFSDQEWEDKVVTFYKEHRNMCKEYAIMEYLKVVQDLEMYGVDFFPIKNKKGTDLYLGVESLGINVYEKENRLAPKLGFPWDEISSISFKDKKFTITPVDDDAPTFIFLATKHRINKKILALCMGNHELFIRRRKTHVAPSQRSSGASASAYLSSLENSKQIKKWTLKEDANVEFRKSCGAIQNTRTSMENIRHKVSVRESVHHYEQAGGYDYPAEIHPRNTTLSQRTNTPSPPPGIQCHDELSKSNRISAVRVSSTKEMRQLAHTSVQEEDGRFVYEQIGPVEYQSPVQSDSSDVPESPTFSSSSTKEHRHIIEFTATDDGDEMVEYATVLPKDTKMIHKEDIIPERRQYLPQNKNTYQKLVELFEDISQMQNDLSLEDRFHREMKEIGANKYTTLKIIRSGYAKDRIALFEAL